VCVLFLVGRVPLRSTPTYDDAAFQAEVMFRLLSVPVEPVGYSASLELTVA
jgi:hypothetical protein